METGAEIGQGSSKRVKGGSKRVKGNGNV